MTKKHLDFPAIDKAADALEIIFEDSQQEVRRTAEALQSAIINSANFPSIAHRRQGRYPKFQRQHRVLAGKHSRYPVLYLLAQLRNKP